MAKYKILNADTKRNIYEFLVDKVSDLNNLPKNVGSTVFVVDTNEKYICNNAKEWKILSNNSSYSSGSDSGSSGDAGSGVMFVTASNSGVLSANFNQLKEAIDNNMLVCYSYYYDNSDDYSVEVLYLTHLSGFVDDEEYSVLFTGTFDDGGSGNLMTYRFVSSSPTGDMEVVFDNDNDDDNGGLS